MTPVVELAGIVKRFPGVLANDHVDLAVEEGEVRALVGENGAGKTTLMNVLYGLFPPDEGRILVRGREVRFRSPLDAIRAGIGMVHQHFMLFSSLTVTENVVYGAEPTRRGLVDIRGARARVVELAERYGLEVDPDRRVGELPVGVQQRVEILKALHRQAQVLILDEPTAVLTPQEKDSLFAFLRELAGAGRTVILITHKLQEVMEVSDRATVMRNGRVTATLRTADTSPEEICRFMVGREVVEVVERRPTRPGPAVLEVEGLSLRDQRGVQILKDVSFHVGAGEIVGIAGVAGNGQSELVEAVCGLRVPDGGRIRIRGREVAGPSVEQRRRAGVSYIPEDRAAVGLALSASVADNLTMGFQRRPELSRARWLVRADRVAERAARLVDRFAIKVGALGDPARTLSGGNLQRLVLAREFDHGAPLLVAEQPTRGLDVGATEFVHHHLVEYREGGNAVLLVSADLGEVLALSDRIYVMYGGRIVGEVRAGEADEYRLGALMAGIAQPTP
jgi:ABC-type uncharacterized transport system ATPase subunit